MNRGAANETAAPARAPPFDIRDLKAEDLIPEARLLGFNCFLGLICALVGADAAAGEGFRRAGAEINVKVIYVAHYVLVIAKCGHDVLGAGDVADLARCDDLKELRVIHGFQRILQRRRE
jgi:hypothetical protein